jgi:hypothetical protein
VTVLREHSVQKSSAPRFYQTVAISRLQEILDAIGIKALVTLSA